MKISGVDIRPGNILEYEKGIWKVAKTQHTQPGKGGAFMQVEMKNLIDGRKTNVRFRSADTVERVRLDTKDFQFLYKEGDDLMSATRYALMSLILMLFIVNVVMGCQSQMILFRNYEDGNLPESSGLVCIHIAFCLS